MQRAMGWPERSVRGFFAGRVKKMPGINMTSEKSENGPRRHRVVRAGELQRRLYTKERCGSKAAIPMTVRQGLPLGAKRA